MLPKGVECEALVAPGSRALAELFSRALRFAESGDGGRALFMTRRPVDEVVRPSARLNKETLRRITFAYPEGRRELVAKCSELHAWRRVPSAIVVEGLDSYIDESTPALVCAALLDAAAACANALGSPCRLCVSIDSEAYENNKKLYTFLLNTYFHQENPTAQSS